MSRNSGRPPRRMLEQPGEWADAALCRGSDTSVWFPDAWDVDATKFAKTLCEACPVITECLEHAMANREPDGIWGGHTAAERRTVHRRRAREAARTRREAGAA